MGIDVQMKDKWGYNLIIISLDSVLLYDYLSINETFKRAKLLKRAL